MQNNLIKRSENPFKQWQKEMNRLMQKFTSDFDETLPDLSEQNFPKLELKDNEKSYLIKAEVPGMSDKDLTVSLKDNCLIIEGERKSESKKEEKGRYFSEFSYGSFYRSLPLEDEVDPDNVRADYKNGILNVELQKTSAGPHKTKRIPVNIQ